MAGESHRPEVGALPTSIRSEKALQLVPTWYSLSCFDRVRFSAGATLLHAFEVNA